ncbi:MAG TPA: CpXC domain-containing protein [Ktedonobacterales bacterium]|jgi:hypothetical protein
MARTTEMTFACPCGTTFTATVHHAVNVTLEPQLLYTLLAGRLNVATCPNCERQIATGLPFIYHDLKRGLFAYVHPNADLPEEDRDTLLAGLRRVYAEAVETSERISPPHDSRPSRARQRHEPADLPRAIAEPEAPPMQVIFGVERLITLVESLLEPEERLGRVALTATGPDPAARERLLDVARRLATQSGCLVDTELDGDTYSVWIYGSRKRVGQLVKLLNTNP